MPPQEVVVPLGSGTTRDSGPAVIVVTGVMAAGKSTVAQLLAEQLPRSVHVRGDVFRRMIVSGREEMTPEPTDEAEGQLRLRYELAAATADRYADAGFTVVVQDILLGGDLRWFVEQLAAGRAHVVVLAPRQTVIERREAGRDKKGYGVWSVADLDAALRETPRMGLWLDTSTQTPDETVAQILRRLPESRWPADVRAGARRE